MKEQNFRSQPLKSSWIQSWLPVFIASACLVAVGLTLRQQQAEMQELWNALGQIECRIRELQENTLASSVQPSPNLPSDLPADTHGSAQTPPNDRTTANGVVGPTLTGGTFDLADHSGKVVIVDFWATWCGPCVAEMPNLLKLYDAYHNEGLEIVGVSLDSDRKALESFVKERGIEWQQIFFDDAGQGWENPLAERFNIHGIPTFHVYDKDGNLAHDDLRGPRLETAIAELLGVDEKKVIATARKANPPPTKPHGFLLRSAGNAETPELVTANGTVKVVATLQAGVPLENRPFRAVAMNWPFAYVLDRSGDLWVFDSSGQPPSQTDPFAYPDTAGSVPLILEPAETVSQIGSGYAVAIADRLLYAADRENLRVYTLDDPANPKHLADVRFNQRLGRVSDIVSDPKHHRIYLIGRGGIETFDVSQPGLWKSNAFVGTNKSTWCAELTATHLFAGASGSAGGIEVFGLNDDRSVTESVAFLKLEHTPYGIHVIAPDRLAVTMTNQVAVVDVSDPTQPKILGPTLPASGRTSAVIQSPSGPILVCNGQLFAFTKDKLELIGSFQGRGNSDGFPYHAASAERHCAIVTGWDTVTVFEYEPAPNDVSAREKGASVAMTDNRQPLLIDDLTDRSESLSHLDAEQAEALIGSDVSEIDLRGLSELTTEVASILVRFPGKLIFSGSTLQTAENYASLAQHEGPLSIVDLKSITPAIARAIAKHKGELILQGLHSLPEGVAESLSGHRERLQFVDLKTISVADAKGFVEHDGDLWFVGLTELTPEAAETLATQRSCLDLADFESFQFVGQDTQGKTLTLQEATASPWDNTSTLIVPGRLNQLTFEMLERLTPETAECLSRWRGHLEFRNGNPFGADVYAALAEHKQRLTITGLASLSTENATVLAQHKGPLWFSGLKELTPDAAEALHPHQAWLIFEALEKLSAESARALATRNGHLQFVGCKMFSDETCRAFEHHSQWLAFQKCSDLTPAVAEALAYHHGELIFDNLKELTPEIAEALRRHKSILTFEGMEELSAEAAKGLAKHRGELWFTGLRELTPEAAKSLRSHTEWLSFDALKHLSPEAATELASRDGHVSFWSTQPFPNESYSALAPHRKRLTIGGLPKLTLGASQALAQHKGELWIEGPKEISVEVAEAFRQHRGELVLEGIENLSRDTARTLASRQGHGLTLIFRVVQPQPILDILAKNPSITWRVE